MNDKANNSAGGGTTLSQVWQLPALGISLAMFGFGLYLSQPGDQTALYAEVLENTRALVGSGQHMIAAEKIDELKGGINAVSDDLQSEFYLLRGDIDFLGQRSKGWSHPKNHEKIIQSYLLARNKGAPLDNEHLQRLGESLADINDFGAAIEYLSIMGDDGSYVRQAIYKRAIRHALDTTPPPPAFAQPAIPPADATTDPSNPTNNDATQTADAATTDPTPVASADTTDAAPDAETPDAKADDQNTDEDMDEDATETSLTAAQYIRGLGFGRKIGYSERDVENLITGLLEEPLLTKENGIWATARSAELLLRQGAVQQANTILLRHIARLLDEPDELKGELMLMLGRTFLARGEGANGDIWISNAINALLEADPLRAEALVEKGRILLNEDNPLGAMDYFNEVIDRYSDTRAYPGALVGIADCEARTGSTLPAMNHYRESVTIAMGNLGIHAQLRELLLQSLRAQHALRFGQGRYNLAMDYLDIESALYPPPGPPELLLKRARTLENLGREKLGLSENDTDTVAAWDALDDEGKEIAANYYADSADAYITHAHLVAIEDDELYGDSLWNAADYYDKSGLHKQAILAFREYVENKSKDPRSLRATFRLAQAQRADNQFQQAINLYKTLIEEHEKSPEAYSSLVPLARSYIAMGKPEDLTQAEHVLGTVVNGHESIRPESREFREALSELGQLYYHRGEGNDFANAAEMFIQYVNRYGAEEPMPELRFQLGDSYRKMVDQIELDLDGSMTPQNRAELKTTRNNHLIAAMENFAEVIGAYEASPEKNPSELQNMYLRNAYFYRADCAFDLGLYGEAEGAIELFNKAHQRYRDHPSALVALMQIFNSQAMLGQWEEARTTNNRAKKLLETIPDEAFDDPTLPMDRGHWQNWLNETSRMMNEGQTQTATVPTAL